MTCASLTFEVSAIFVVFFFEKDKEAAEKVIRQIIEYRKMEALLEHIDAWRKEIELTEYLNKFEEMVNKKTELDKRRGKCVFFVCM